MKRFLFVMFEAGGNVPPQLGIVRRLVERGHVVRVLADRVLAVRRLLDESRFHESARTLAERMREERKTDRAVEELEGLVARRAAA